MAEQYFVAVSEPKAALDLSLEEVDQLTMERNDDGAEISPNKPKPVKVGGVSALERRFILTQDKLRIQYIRCVVDGPEHFHYLSFWTLASRAKTSLPVLEAALRSFKLVPSVAKAEKSEGQ